MSELDSEFKQAKQSPGFLLWRASNQLQKIHRRGLAAYDITSPEFSVLACIVFFGAGKSLTQQEIAKHSGLDKMYVSDIIKRLLKKRFIFKDPNPLDKRSYLIRVTKLGKSRANKGVKYVESVDKKFFSTLGDIKVFIEELNSLCYSK